MAGLPSHAVSASRCRPPAPPVATGRRASYAGLDTRALRELTPAPMRRLLPFLLLSFVVSCSGGTKGRTRQISTAKAEALGGGARQAQEFAAAVHHAYEAGDYAKRSEVGVTNANEV